MDKRRANCDLDVASLPVVIIDNDEIFISHVEGGLYMKEKDCILAVDDAPEILAILVDTLTREGYQVDSADSGRSALEYVAGNKPDLILLDVRMPGIDGLEVCRRLKSNDETRHIPIILISAFAHVKEWVEGLQLGAADFITKPFKVVELLTRVRIHLALVRANERLKQQTVVLQETEEQLKSEIAEHRRLDGVERSRRAMLSVLEDLKQTEGALRTLSMRQRALLFAIPDIIMEVDINRVYIWANEAGIEFFGENVVGKEAVFYFEGYQETYDAVQPLFEGSDRVIEVESWQRRKDGEKRLLAWRCRALKDESGKVTGVLSSAQDITARKEDEEEIRKLNDELEARVRDRTAQLESANKRLEAFSYSVSHDLRAPLRSINGYNHILLEDYGHLLNEDGRKVCESIRRNVKTMEKLIDDLLTFSRVGRAEIRFISIDMAALAESVLQELVTPEKRKMMDIEIRPLASANGDPSLLKQVWMNLLSNAIKFSSKKESVHIEVDCEENEEEIIYSVRDSGAGFDMEYAHRLFGVFQRLHSTSEFEGTGVGLAIVNLIVTRHGGRVWAKGGVDRGATFSFALKKKVQY